MGMYTGFRFKGIIKKEYREDIKKALNDFKEVWKNCEHEELKKFYEVDYSSFIPFGALCYMPNCWEESDSEEATNGFEQYFNEKNGLLCFQCSLKDDETIEYFIEKIIPIICKKLIHCEELYEQSNVSDLYELKGGILKKLDYGIRYREEDYYFSDNVTQTDKNILYENFDFTKENKYR